MRILNLLCDIQPVFIFNYIDIQRDEVQYITQKLLTCLPVIALAYFYRIYSTID